MTKFDLMVDLHKDSERQGPGSPQDTLRALESVQLHKQDGLRVADIGCGTGGQTLTLADHIDAEIVAVDLFDAFLERLNVRAHKIDLTGRIKTRRQSMDELTFEPASLDLIWSEGAIYNIGFEQGVSSWKQFLKPGGYLAVSEITWITNTRPAAIEDFWKREYPGIDTAGNNIRVLEENGFTLAGYFYLLQNSWIDNYYAPLQARIPAFLERNAHSEMARKVADETLEEIVLYERYKDYYSYGFYIAKKE